jgi:GntR family transcriptional regulator, carbon starvation induced regulator
MHGVAMRQISDLGEALDVEVVGPIQSEVAYLALRQEIISCKLRPGSKLKMNEIAVRIGVSVSAVREALSRMVIEDLVVATAQKGFSVSPISIAEIKDLTKTRITIETLCLIDSLRNGGIDWESRIVATFHKLSRIPYNDPETGLANEEWVLTHAEFHKALAQACTSRWLLKIRSSLYTQAERYRQLAGIVRHVSRDVNAEHKGLMDAALARDEQLIASRIEHHFTITTDVILASL